MAYHPLLIEILVGINQQDTPFFLLPHTPEMTISRLCFRNPKEAEYTLQGPPQLIDVQQQPDQALLTADNAGLFLSLIHI